jgi:hypothetical protein
MIHIPIEQRYDRRNQMFHSSAFVIAGTVVSVAAAGAGAYMSTQAANKAAAAQSAAAKKYGKGLDEIQLPEWNIAKDIKDAKKVTKYNIEELEKIFPGAKTSREIAGQTAIAYQKGEIPQDVRDSIMRSVAELGGAGFAPQQEGMPQVGGFQAAQGLLGRQIGKMSVELSGLGNQISQGWQALAGSFIESPLQVGQARLGFERAAAEIQMGIEGGKYGAAVNTIGANLAANQALASGISSTGQALGGGLSSYGMARGMAQSGGSVAGFGSLSDNTLYATPQMSQQISNRTMPSISDRPFALPKSQLTPSAQRALTEGYR